MLIFPAIDIIAGKAVRLYKGDYEKMTVYGDDPAKIGLDFKSKGASHIHIVDLEGAKTGLTPNFDTVCRIKEETGLFCEIGGGIRNMATVEKYISAGLDRVILGTAAVTDESFLKNAVSQYGEKIAVGIDIRDGFVSVKGWTESSGVKAEDFFRKAEKLGVSTVICTDISKDGAMEGTNHDLYTFLKKSFNINITASGGVSSLKDVERLSALGLYGAIIGKAYYTGDIDLRKAVEVAE